MNKKILLITSIILLLLTGCGKKITSIDKFEEVMLNNNFKTNNRLEKLSNDEVWKKYNNIDDYESSIEAYNNDSNIIVEYTIYKSSKIPKKQIDSIKETLSANIKDSKSGSGFKSYYTVLNNGNHEYYINVNNSFLHITFSEKDKDTVIKIINELEYSDYI